MLSRAVSICSGAVARELESRRASWPTAPYASHPGPNGQAHIAFLETDLAGLALMVSACAAPTAQPPAEPERIPELPAQGRVSLVPNPSECSPTCLAGLTRARKSSEATLTGSGLLAPSVSDPGTADYALPMGRPLPRP